MKMKKLILLPVLVLIPLIMILWPGHDNPDPRNAPFIILRQGNHELHFNPRSGLLEYSGSSGTTERLSDSVFDYADYTLENRNDSSLSIIYTGEGLRLRLVFNTGLIISARFESTKPQVLSWPVVSISKSSQFLIWPQNEGYYIPFSDTVFARKFDRRTVDATILSLPFWAVEKNTATAMYEMTSTFHSDLLFTDRGATMELKLMHHYVPNASMKEPYEVRIIHVSNHSPVSAALFFRKELEEKNARVTLMQKMRSVPHTGRMIGAPWARLVSGQFISRYDVKEGKFNALAKAIIDDVQNHRGFVSGQWEKLEQDQRDAVDQASRSEKLSDYGINIFIRAMEALLKEEGVNDEFAKHRRENAGRLYAAYPDYLLPPGQWGTGVSFRMVDALKEAGIDRMILQANGHQVASDHKEVVEHAFDLGYLFGIYDSYHSIHDPSTYGTDDSWETAQMPGVSFESVRMRREDGTGYSGFRSTGGLANPKAIRSFYEKRIRRNFEEVPYSYYFIDCDAFGEYYDDYSENHPLTKQEDAALRMDRLKWLRSGFRVPVGSEKATFLFADILDINEGVTVPVFGFDDRDMNKDKGSPYFKGKYWPPEMMDIFFKEIPLKEKYQHLYFDLRFKIPLWETVYHDCLISTAHPSSPSLKYSGIKTDVALTEMFYQYPPVYNLNYDFFLKNKERIVHEYRFYSLTHPKTVKYPATGFEFLTADRLVQRIQFGKIRIVANFGAELYRFEEEDLPGKSILFIDEDGKTTHFDPEDF